MSYDINDFFGTDAVSDNAADFSKSLMNLSEYATKGMEAVIRKTCIDLYRSIVERTPVDTGRAKVNWQISTTDSDTVRHDKDGYSFNEANKLIDDEVGDFSFDIYDGQVIIYNNLEYISELENGTSEQAPYGMVSVSLAEFEAHFLNELAKLEGLEPA